MSLKSNELRSLVEMSLQAYTNSFTSITAKELAQKLNREPAHISQILRTLVIQGKIQSITKKRSMERKVRHYYSEKETIIESALEKKTCGECQWLSSIQRCTLLDIAYEKNPSLLSLELRERVRANAIPRDTPKCQYFDQWVSGQLKSKHFEKFVKDNTRDGYFLCPILRCRKVIQEFSHSLQKILLGSNPFYCPHCGAPMEFGYDEHFDDYRVYYWDSHFDILQKSIYEITGVKLPERNPPKRKYGVSILKENSFTLKKKPEVLFVGSKTTPDRLGHSPDLTFFPLRKLNYIYTRSWEDYNYLETALHVVDPESDRKLYKNIKLYPPRENIPSSEPLEKEVGGNELLIASGILNVPAFRANLITRETVLAKKLQQVDADLKPAFTKAYNRVRSYNQLFDDLQTLDYKQWLRFEGGCANLMLEPFKLEARKYGFFVPSREDSRMVRSERFLPYGLFYARSAYDSLINGVNHVITSYLKREVYNTIPLAWRGLRGWCHRGYPHGLYLDTIDQGKNIDLLWIHEAIRNKEISPNDFTLYRGKRYDPYYCIPPDSEGYIKIKRIGYQVLRTKMCLAFKHTNKYNQIFNHYCSHQKSLLNMFANHSTELIVSSEIKPHNYITLWKKLEQTKSKDILTAKELQQITYFSRKFFSKEFTFQPLAITEIY